MGSNVLKFESDGKEDFFKRIEGGLNSNSPFELHVLLSLLENSPDLNRQDVDFLRDLSVRSKNRNPILSYYLLNFVYNLRPGGRFICDKLVEFNDQLGVGVSKIERRANLFLKYNRKILSISIAEKNKKLFPNKDSLVAPFNSRDKGSVTILAALGQNVLDKNNNIVSHFLGILTYACILGSRAEFSEIKVIFTCEWGGGNYEGFKEKINKAFSIVGVSKTVQAKINFIILDDPHNLPLYIKGTVLKIKSIAEKHSTFIYEDYIYERFPVVTTSFNTKYIDDYACDISLVRSIQDVEEKRRLYVQPSFHKVSSVIKKGSKVLVTAYTADRLKRMVEDIKESEWVKLCNIFEAGYSWMLVGYHRPEDLLFNIPDFVLEKYRDNLILEPYSDLESLFEKGVHSLLCYPIFLGGGGTARLAASYNIPVLCVKDSKSDVSNILPQSNLSIDFVDILEKVFLWESDESERDTFVLTQKASFEAKSDFLHHKSFLPEAINEAIDSYKERLKKNISDNFGL